EAISVEYAVRVAMGQQLEGQRKWGDALEQFKEAASLWKKGRLAQNGPQPSVANEGGQPPHVAGLTRARTLHKLLDETDSTLDKAAKLLEPIGADLGIGNTARKRFHDKLKAAPLDPKIYAEEALTRIRTARVANSDTTELQKVQAQAKRFLDASEKVVPGDPMGRFYKGVLAFMAGYPKKGLDGMRAAYKAGYKGRAAELYLAETLSLRDKHAEALTHWKKAWQAETADTYVGRRMVEALVARGELKAARKLLARMLEERTPDRDLIEAQVLVHLHTKNYDALRQVLLLDRTQFTANAPAEIERTRRITTAVYNKLGKARVNGEIMKPGEEMVDRLYGYAIPVDGLKVTAEKRVQSAILVLTTQGLIVLRWDTSKDYRKEIETGARLAKRAVRVGVKLSGEFAGLHLGDGIGKLVQLLDLLPESKPREKTKKESLLDSTVGLAIDSLDLFDSLRGDLELQVAGKDIKAHRIGRGTVVAWELLPVDPSKGLYAVHARTRDGVSPWRTDTDRLLVHTDRPARLRMYLQHVLQAKK
ncbi:MAG: tetratricopeptide repeat protein, partial [Myxococcales bacterium]|nr:tetratricopeptide repeat protein [Myxococcales bacterium]